MNVVQDEAFCPVFIVEKLSNKVETISIEGLFGSVWIRDTTKAERSVSIMYMGTV